MINTHELKQQARTHFKANYWRAVLVAFVLAGLVRGMLMSILNLPILPI